MAPMPMFPLGMVLMPGMVLPLHVFEPRYRQLVRDCLEAPTQEFGVVLIGRGSEVGGGDERLDVGTVARIVQVGALADGRFAMITVGDRRIRVVEWLIDDPYPRADVEEWPDEAGAVDEERLEVALARAKRCAALAVELGDRAGVPEASLSGDPTLDTFIIAATAPLGAVDRFAALSAPGPGARLLLLEQFLDDVESTLRFRLG
jgi:Lon protease-like protein